mmetsp:Transcript_23572/g.29001  ORF Transcript_23572/g.29001 Transcript_23572/m.29001 type:complete len:208 (-) Transcript_23572:834-1457(-)
MDVAGSSEGVDVTVEVGFGSIWRLSWRSMEACLEHPMTTASSTGMDASPLHGVDELELLVAICAQSLVTSDSTDGIMDTLPLVSTTSNNNPPSPPFNSLALAIIFPIKTSADLRTFPHSISNRGRLSGKCKSIPSYKPSKLRLVFRAPLLRAKLRMASSTHARSLLDARLFSAMELAGRRFFRSNMSEMCFITSLVMVDPDRVGSCR